MRAGFFHKQLEWLLERRESFITPLWLPQPLSYCDAPGCFKAVLDEQREAG
jgi:hypothetical protein